jgi:hypothetical protein
MDRINRFIAQVYGYAVCLITVIVMLISIKGLIDAAFDLSDPVRAEGGYGRFGPLTSFELYKLQARRQIPMDRYGPTTATVARAPSVDSLSDAELRTLFNAERESQIGNAKFRAMRKLVSGLLFIILAGALFAIHWRWLKGIMAATNSA